MSPIERALAPAAAPATATGAATFPEEYGRPLFLFNVYRLTVGLLLLLIVIFIGFLNHFRTMYFDTRTPELAAAPVTNGVEISPWMTLPMWMALLPVFVLGIWWPQELWRYFGIVAADLGGGAQ